MGDHDPLTDRGGGEVSFGGGGGGSSVSCSICLEDVVYNEERSRARLQCGHEFHLDCIGSAFNMKGVMQCPNCRKVEKGQWLFSSGCRTLPELSMDDWAHDEDLYDLGYPGMPFGVHWCPFSGLARVPSSFDEGESPLPAYHDLLEHQAVFAEHTVAPSAGTHSCPYFAYFQPLQPSSSNSSESVSYGDISTSHTFTAVDLHYHSWDHHSAPFSSGNDQSAVPSATIRSRGDSDRSFAPPFLLGHGSAPRAGSVTVSSMVPPYPSGNSRVHERVQGPHAYHQHQQPAYSTARRSTRGITPGSPVPSTNENANGFYVIPPSGSSGRILQEPDNSMRNRFYAWERDHFTPFPLVPVDRESSSYWPHAGGLDTSGRGTSSNYWHRHGSERMQPPQSRPESSSASSGRITYPFI